MLRASLTLLWQQIKGPSGTSPIETGLLLSARFILALVFALAGANKLWTPMAFGESIANYRIVPASLIPWIATTLPGLELVLAGALVFGCALRGACLLSSLLMGAFTIIVIQAWFRGLNIDCGCFGSEEILDAWTLARDIGLFLISLVPAIRYPSLWQQQRL